MQDRDEAGVSRHVLPPLEMPKCVQDVKTDLVQIFLSNMSSDEVCAFVWSVSSRKCCVPAPDECKLNIAISTPPPD